jgi:metal transporter CNNM
VAMGSKPQIAAGRTRYNGYTTARPAVLGLAKVLVTGLLQISSVAAAPLFALGHSEHDEEDGASPDDPSMWLYLGMAAVLVLLGGAFAGLTIA